MRTGLTRDRPPGNVYRQDGTVGVWSDPNHLAGRSGGPAAATLVAGEMTGELSMLDQGVRTADLITGPMGATVLALDREHLLALREDDPELGSLLLWNIAKAMSGRVRFILWQLQRTYQRLPDRWKTAVVDNSF
jgi:CRP-like cAMP-binding protein